MPRYYFDLHEGAEITFDDGGVELADIGAARRLAVESLGQSIIDHAAGLSAERFAVEVRDQTGPILRASAATLVEELRMTPHR